MLHKVAKISKKVVFLITDEGLHNAFFEGLGDDSVGDLGNEVENDFDRKS